MDTLTERTPRVVSAVKLLRTAERRKTGRFLAEGTNSVAEALAAGAVEEMFFREDSAASSTRLARTVFACPPSLNERRKACRTP